MELSDFEIYLAERYRYQMEYYKATAAKNQRTYRRLQWALIILSLLTPIFTALKLGDNDFIINNISLNVDILTLIIASSVAILTTALKTFNYQELWILSRTTYEQLKPEIHYYNFNLGPYAAPLENKEAIFVTRVEGILQTERSLWPPTKVENKK
jgi:hypothetical protein